MRHVSRQIRPCACLAVQPTGWTVCLFWFGMFRFVLFVCSGPTFCCLARTEEICCDAVFARCSMSGIRLCRRQRAEQAPWLPEGPMCACNATPRFPCPHFISFYLISFHFISLDLTSCRDTLP